MAGEPVPSGFTTVGGLPLWLQITDSAGLGLAKCAYTHYRYALVPILLDVILTDCQKCEALSVSLVSRIFE